MGCGVLWQQIGELDRALGKLRSAGMGAGSSVFDQLYQVRGRVFGQIGFKLPRTITLLLRLVGMSPGVIKLWHDVEAGWLAEARDTPKAPPVYHYVGDELAFAIMRNELSEGQKQFLHTPDTYIGE